MLHNECCECVVNEGVCVEVFGFVLRPRVLKMGLTFFFVKSGAPWTVEPCTCMHGIDLYPFSCCYPHGHAKLLLAPPHFETPQHSPPPYHPLLLSSLSKINAETLGKSGCADSCLLAKTHPCIILLHGSSPHLLLFSLSLPSLPPTQIPSSAKQYAKVQLLRLLRSSLVLPSSHAV